QPDHARIEPPPSGRPLVERARALLHGASELQREVALLKGGDTGELTVSAGAYPAELCIPGALALLLSTHPRISVRVRVRDWRDIAADVESEAVDVGLGEISEAEGHDRLETELVGAHEILFVGRPGHPLSTRRRVGFDEIFAFPLAGTAWPARAAKRLPPGPLAGGTVDRATGRFYPVVTVDRAADVKELVQRTDFLTFLTRSQCAAELADGTLAALPFAAPWARTNYGFVWRRGRMRTPAALAFAAAVRAVEAERRGR
ncbi:MAG TPA: substrate-binding domain-containing protein, partial [Thermoanaerobaculia bacterium]|nr:substrate-binding domain-containing protein [Thermoanaerobaculia bacterium]